MQFSGESMNFSEALIVLKNGGRVSRIKWLKNTVSKPFISIAYADVATIDDTHMAYTKDGKYAYFYFNDEPVGIFRYKPTIEDLLADDWVRV